MKVTLKDAYGREVSLGAESLKTGSMTLSSLDEVVIEVSGSLEQLAVSITNPQGSSTQGSTSSLAGEPDPRTVPCPKCPHPASEHSDSGCIAHHVQDKEFRTPGVMGYCKCESTYSQVMAARK